MTSKTNAIAAICLGLAALLLSAQAQAAEQHSGDIAAGKALADPCAACHGEQGQGGDPGMPRLAGQHAEYLSYSLAAYRAGDRKNDEMRKISSGMSDEDIANLAAYFASQTPRAPVDKPPLPDDEDPFAKIRAATEECANCHGEDGNAEDPGMPSLAGQHVAYLIDAMRAYQEGRRKEEEMQMFAEPLKGPEIEDMAYFYAAMKPKRAAPSGEGDVFAGQAVTAPCVGCHADDGNNKDPKTPRLAGLDAEYLISAVKAYKEGSRDHSVMQEAVAAMRDAEIVDMAAFYSSQEPRALPMRKPLTVRQWVSRCNRCHGPDGRSTDSRFPILAGQDEAYLVKTLKLYHVGERPSTTMQAMSFPMAESDILKLAAYYSRQAPVQ